MAHFVDFKKSARKEADALPLAAKNRILSDIYALADNPRPPGCKKLKGRDNEYRIRVGDYRIVYEVHDAVLIVLVIGVAHRGKVYK